MVSSFKEAPQQPVVTNVSAAVAYEEITLSWDNPNIDDDVEVEIKLTSESDTDYSAAYSGTSSNHTEVSLINGTLYSMRVRAIDPNGQYRPSEWVELDNIMPTGRLALYVHNWNILLVDAGRRDVVYSDPSLTTEAGQDDDIRGIKDLSSSQRTIGEAASAGEYPTYDLTNGRISSTHSDNESYVTVSPQVSLTHGCIAFSIDFNYAGDPAAQRLMQLIDNSVGFAFNTRDDLKFNTDNENITAVDISPAEVTDGQHGFLFMYNNLGDRIRIQVYMDSATTPVATVETASLDSFTFDTIGNETGGTQKSITDGYRHFMVSDEIPADEAARAQILTAMATTGTQNPEDWTPDTVEPPPGTRPSQLAHLETFNVAKAIPENTTGAPDLQLLSFPRKVLTESKAMRNNSKYGQYQIVSAQKSAISTMNQLAANYGVMPMTHMSNSANQGWVIANVQNDLSIRGEEGFGLAFDTLGTVNVGTHDNPTLHTSAFGCHPAAILSQTLGAGENAEANVNLPSSLDVGHWMFIGASSDDGFLTEPIANLEMCRLVAKPNASRIRVVDRGSAGTTAKSYPPGTYLRTIGVGPSGNNFYNLRYNISDHPNVVDFNGDRFWEKFAEFLAGHIDVDANGNTIAGYFARCIGWFTDIDRHEDWWDRGHDLLWINTGNAGWGGAKNQINYYSLGQLALRYAVRAALPSRMICVGGTEHAYPMQTRNGNIVEDLGEGPGQQSPNIGEEKYDGIMQRLYTFTKYSEFAPALVGIGDKHGAQLNAPTAQTVQTNTYCAANMCIIDGVYGKMNKSGQDGNYMDAPHLPEESIYIGQAELAGNGYQHGECMFSYDGLHGDDDAMAGRGWLGAPLWEAIRHYDHGAWSIANAIETEDFSASDNGWEFRNCEGEHNGVDNALEWQGWSGTSAQGTFNASYIEGGAFTVTQGTRYTFAFDVNRIPGGDFEDFPRICRLSLFDNSNDKQHYYIWPDAHILLYVFTAQSSGTFPVRIETAYQNVPWQIRTIRQYQGDLRLFRRDFENGTVVVNGAGSPSRSIPLGGNYRAPLLTGPNAATYDPPGRLNRAQYTQFQLRSTDGMFFVRDE